MLREYMNGGGVYVRLEFDPYGTEYRPAIFAKPARVAEWLRKFADDIEGLDETAAVIKATGFTCEYTGKGPIPDPEKRIT